MSVSSMANPLAGVRVLEFGQYIAGPYGTMQLADLGAEVVKIERPDGGDPFRAFISAANISGYAPNFVAFNRNKRSLTLDVQSPRGREVFLRLAEDADVVVENLRAGVMDRLAIGYDVLHARNPRLIYCSISGFSEDGPYRDRPAFDTVGQALSGILHLFTDPADPRMRGPTITDQLTGMQAAGAVCAALFARVRTGQGARIDLSMLDAAIGFTPDSFAAYTQSGIDMQPETRTAWSHSFVFTCADGRMVAVHVGGPERFWQALLAAMGQPAVGEDPRYVGRSNRVANFAALIEDMRPIFLAHPRAYWMARFAEQDVPASVIHTIPEAMQDPEVVHSGIFRQAVHPVHGAMTTLNRTVRIDGQRDTDPLLPPLLGEHTAAVLGAAGYTEEDIARLRADAVI
jgi:crotonobetainyl-CoA:carnitine CoA-transferase CaiB-like acyl-CoA transferase